MGDKILSTGIDTKWVWLDLRKEVGLLQFYQDLRLIFSMFSLLPFIASGYQTGKGYVITA